MKSPFISLLLVIVFMPFAHGQMVEVPDSLLNKDDLTWVKVRTQNGDNFSGYLIEQSSEMIHLRDFDLDEEYRILFKDIKEINYQRVNDFNEAYYNLQASRYFFGPNAFGLKRGEGYYQNNWVFLNQVSVGLSERFTLGVGTVPLFIFGYGAPSPVWLSPKFNIPIIKNKLSIALGGLFGSVLGSEYNNAFGIAYGAITLGDRNTNLNLSMGYGMADGEWADLPTISLSGMVRLTRKFYIISENYFIADVIITSFGGRTVWDEVSLDYGLGFVLPTNYENFSQPIGLPWLGLTVPFKIQGK